MLGLVAGVVLVLSSDHVQEAVHHGHTLVEALGRQLDQVTPASPSFTGVPPQNLHTQVQSQLSDVYLCFIHLSVLLRLEKKKGLHLTAQSSLGERWPTTNGEEGLLAAAHLRAA